MLFIILLFFISQIFTVCINIIVDIIVLLDHFIAILQPFY